MHHSYGCGASFRLKISGSSQINKIIFSAIKHVVVLFGKGASVTDQDYVISLTAKRKLLYHKGSAVTYIKVIKKNAKFSAFFFICIYLITTSSYSSVPRPIFFACSMQVLQAVVGNMAPKWS